MDASHSSEDDEIEGWVWRGIELHEQFERYGKIDDIEESITLFKLANDSTPIPHPEKPDRLEELGISVRARFLRLGRPEDLQLAINVKQLALDLTPNGNLDTPLRLKNLPASSARDVLPSIVRA